MANIYAPTSPVARCSKCGTMRQNHARSEALNPHDFIAETADDYDPGDLTPVQLVDAINGAELRWIKVNEGSMSDADWDESERLEKRMEGCRVELRARVRVVFGVTFDDLMGALG